MSPSTSIGLVCRSTPSPVPVWPVYGLDRTGTSIPATNHTPPAGAIFMAPGGTGSGTQASPVGTLNAAVAACPNGGTIVFRAGVYHDAYTATGGILSSKFVTMQAFPGEQVWFDGTSPTRSTFGTFGTSGAAGTFIFRGFGIRNYNTVVEPTVGNSAIYCARGTNNNATHILEDMVFKGMVGGGLTVQSPRGDRGARMTRCVVVDMGSLGLNVPSAPSNPTRVAGAQPTWQYRNDFIVEDSYFARCNLSDITGTSGATQAGVKFEGQNGFTARGCIFEDINPTGNFGAGIWGDVMNTDVRIYNCVARNCARAGFFSEVGQNTIFASLLAINCGIGTTSPYHASIRIATRAPRVYHCTSVGGGLPIEIYDDLRSIQSDGFGPDTDDVELVSNLFAGPLTGVHASSNRLSYFYSNGAKTTADGPNNIAGTTTQPSAWWNSPGRWVKNGWYKGGATNVALWQQGGNFNYATSAALHSAQPLVGTNTDLDLAADPFVDRAGYAVKAASPAFNAGDPLPADIAALLGKTPGSVWSLGFIDAPVPTW